MTDRPSNSAAIVTGHSRGLGAAIAAELLSRGIPVLGASRHENPELREQFPSLLRQESVDLSDAGAVARFADSVAFREFTTSARQPCLVNNAGLLEPIGPLQSQHVDDVARAVAVNVAAVLMLSVAFVKHTAQSGDRRILQISSGAGRKAYAGWSVYCSTKAALDHHARCVAMDHTPGLRIASTAPGVIDTDMQALIRASTDANFPDRPRFVEMHREGKLRSAQAVSRALADFLLSDAFGAEPVNEMTY
ncbi:MAG TPA: SDR family oxidoreductase [Gemmatimonadaceae bacterium]|nr:SDR family oxidoreductase [Gemmatimonadaceae bacterium]